MAQANPFGALLDESRDQFRDRLGEAIGALLAGAEESLGAQAEKADAEDERRKFRDAIDFALAHREAIEGQFRRKLDSEFRKRADKARHVASSLADFSLDDLALVEEDDLSETLKLNDMAARVRRFCEEELGALDQRAAVLLGDANLEADDNPFGTKTLFDAFKSASRQGDASLEQRLMLLRLFEGAALEGIRECYRQVNALLVDNGILPKIKFAVSKGAESKPLPADAPEEPAAAAPAAPAPKDEDVMSMITRMLNPGGAPGAAGAPGSGLGVGGLPVVEGAALASSLTNLQVGDLAALGEAAAELGPILAEAGNLKNVLHQLKSTSVGGSMGQVDAATLDVVALLFDELFEDERIPVALKSLIGRLQLPMLKVAIADKDLFTSPSHPARQLLDTLGAIGLRLPEDFDEKSPLFPRLEAFVDDLVDRFREKMDVFDEVRAQLEALIVEDERRVAAAMAESRAGLERAESLAVAKAAAQEQIRNRVVALGGHPPRAVIQFLAQQWIKHLVIVHAREGAASAAWREGLATIDQLLWSVSPKPTPEDQRQLARTIPPLLKSLRGGVTAAGIPPEATAAFFADLMRVHTEVMKGPAPAPAMTRQEKIAKVAKLAAEGDLKAMAAIKKAVAHGDEDAKKALELMIAEDRARQARAAAPAKPAAAAKPAAPPKPAEDDLLDFTQPVTVNNPFGAGTVEVCADDLDFTAAPAAPEAPAAPAPAEAKLTPAAMEASIAPSPGAPVKPRTIRLPSGLAEGAWVEILDPETERKAPAKLHYVSPKRSHFLFVDRRGQKVFECSRSMLARRIKLGELVLLEGEPDPPLFDRLLEGLFGKLKARAAATA